MQPENFKMQEVKKLSALFDPELPTANDVMAAICCVATQYALNPTMDLAKLALGLANSLSAPEYAETKYIKEVAKKLIAQWDAIVKEFKAIEASVMPQHYSLQ